MPVTLKKVNRGLNPPTNIKRACAVPLYSTWLFPAVTPVGVYRFFTVGLNNLGQGFGAVAHRRIETNLVTGGQLPSEYDFFEVEAIGFNFMGNLLNAAATQNLIIPYSNMLEFGWLEFQTGNTKIPLGPAKLYPAGCGQVAEGDVGSAGIGVGGAVSVCQNNNGLPTKTAVRKFKYPILLRGSQSFSVNYILELVNTNVAAVRATIYLYGKSIQKITN